MHNSTVYQEAEGEELAVAVQWRTYGSGLVTRASHYKLDKTMECFFRSASIS